ncbi:MAG: polyribonucleotide nucleotidyltransferase [Candidatus Gracilibacteria bacterium]|nr:polyribonucleotide nucleotidyltransferase [Candidatus Gracilibacteria bacterium]
MIAGLSDQNALTKAMVTKTYEVGGKKITFESGRLALLADGAVVVRDEEGNYLLVTAGIKDEVNMSASFFPLSCEFQEKYYATGKIGGNRFMKREGRPSEAAVLNSRMIDRPIRPMFPKGTINDIQIIATIMSSSGTSDYGFYGITGASLALQLAGVTEFEGPVAGVRIALLADGTTFKFDPSIDDLATALLDLTVAGTEDAITMVESQGKEVDESVMIRAFEFAHALVRDFVSAQRDFVAHYSKTYPITEQKLTIGEDNAELKDVIDALITDERITKLYHLGKTDFHHALVTLEEEMKLALAPTDDSEPYADKDIEEAVYSIVKKHMRKNILATGLRLDGRKVDEVRPIRGTFGILPRVHGSALFQRGITQALTIATLGGPGDIQIIDDMFEENTKRYIHHYNFPPFSVGEVRPLRGVGRREVGHGRLAEKALEPVLPSLEKFPYFIRMVSEITTCNGSSSMASVCGSTMAMMDAGVPITALVSGVAMGMIYDDATGKYVVLSDIQAQEDFLGDLDFKIARTSKGITALQMDCKIAGLSMEVVGKVFAQAKGSLDHIRTEMSKELSAPRPTLSPYAPFILSIVVPETKMREVIGKGGETIQGIERTYGVEVNLADDGQCSITAKNQASGQAALDVIKGILKDDEVGDLLEGKVVKILEGVGAIVEWAKGKSGMIHISKIAKERVTNIEDFLKMGDVVQVKIIAVDKEKGRVGLERIIAE